MNTLNVQRYASSPAGLLEIMAWKRASSDDGDQGYVGVMPETIVSKNGEQFKRKSVLNPIHKDNFGKPIYILYDFF